MLNLYIKINRKYAHYFTKLVRTIGQVRIPCFVFAMYSYNTIYNLWSNKPTKSNLYE